MVSDHKSDSEKSLGCVVGNPSLCRAPTTMGWRYTARWKESIRKDWPTSRY